MSVSSSSDNLTPDSSPTRGASSLGLMLLLLCAMGAGPLFNYAVSTLSALLIQDFGVTAGQVGQVATVVFAAAAISSFTLGRLADTWSHRSQLAFIFLGTAIAVGLAAFANSWWVIMVAAVIAGPMQAISNPTTNRIILDKVPLKKRTGWIGVKQSGVQVAQLFAGIALPVIGLWGGWSGAMLVTAVLCVAMWLWSLAVVPPRPPELAPPAQPRRRLLGKKTATPATEKVPPVVFFFAGIAMLSGFGMQATNVYMPLFSIETLNFSLVLGGATAAASGLIGVASRIGWSRMVQAGYQPSTLLMVISAGAVLGVSALLGAALTGQAWLVWVGALLHGLTVLGTNVVTNAGVLQLVPPSRVGIASGINAAGMYTGFAAGPLVIGWLRDVTGDFTVGWILVAVSYAACVIVALIMHNVVGPRRRTITPKTTPEQK